MSEQPAKPQLDLNAIAVANGCQELAVFDLSRGGQKLPCIHYARIGQEPAADEKQAAIAGLERVVKIFQRPVRMQSSRSLAYPRVQSRSTA